MQDPENLKDASGNRPICAAMFIGGGIGLIKELWHNDGRPECVNWHSVARSAMLGGIFGAAREALGAFVGGLLGEEAAVAWEGLQAAGIDIGAEVGAVTGDGVNAAAEIVGSNAEVAASNAQDIAQFERYKSELN